MMDLLDRLFFFHDGYRRSDLSEGDEISVMIDADEEIRRLRAALAEARKVIERNAEGWANAIELELIPSRHVMSASILRDESRAWLEASVATRP